MASPEEMAATMLANIPEKTGKSLAAWHAVLQKTSLEKHGQLVGVLKKEYGVTHGFANLIVSKFLAADPVADVDLVDQQYAGGKAELRPVYDALIKAVSGFGKDVEIAPKKAYVSLRRKKQFGLIQPSTKTRVDVGLNLSGVDASERLEASGSFNAMVTHRVRLGSVDEVDSELTKWLRQAYEGAK
jgi:predicted transport protein